MDEISAIYLVWEVSTLPADEFSFYRVYRRELGETEWHPLIDIPDQADTDHYDVIAGQTIIYEYRVTQFQKIVGDVDLEADESVVVTTVLEADQWFLVPNDLYAREVVVIDEEHTTVIQQEAFEPLAHNRKRILRGKKMGDEGTLTIMVDRSEARLSKIYFNTLVDLAGPHILKSPFGDVWFVEFDAPAFKYAAGGHLQVDIGWVEIA